MVIYHHHPLGKFLVHQKASVRAEGEGLHTKVLTDKGVPSFMFIRWHMYILMGLSKLKIKK